MPIYRCVVDLSFPFGSGGGTNTWHVRTDTEQVAEGTNISSQMDSVRQWYDATATLWAPGTVASWNGNYVAVDGGETLELNGIEPWSEPIGRTTTEESAGNAVMACVTWRSQQRSRRGRGRTFLGPLAGPVVAADGTLATNDLLTLTTANTALIARSTDGDFQGALVVWSEVDNVGRDIVRASVTDQVAVLRSRRS